ncbi:MAG: hypothetical protein NNA22_02070 [Nitrospira sp.]|nr:hypothetical protein [Nitrospira sp.]
MIKMIGGESFKTGLEGDAHSHELFTYFFLADFTEKPTPIKPVSSRSENLPATYAQK